MPIIPATNEVEVEGLQFEAALGKNETLSEKPKHNGPRACLKWYNPGLASARP
jgi:hypothetical protein